MYKKLTQKNILRPHKCCHNSAIRGNYAILFTLELIVFIIR